MYNLSEWNKITEEPPELKHNQLVVFYEFGQASFGHARLMQFKGEGKDGVFIEPDLGLALPKTCEARAAYAWGWVVKRFNFFCLASNEGLSVVEPAGGND
jgi:hypothetical protein